MAQEVKLMGATYSDVPSVMLPDSTNVLHKFTDTSNSTLARADQLPLGVTAYDKTGTLLTGTAPDTSHIVADYRLSETALGSDGTVDLSEAIDALTTYSNEVTGASDTTLSDAVGSLVDGYGGGGSVLDEYLTRTISGSLYNDTLKTLGNSALRNCTALTSVDFPNVTKIYSESLNGCKGLTSVHLPKANAPDNYTSAVFMGCSKLTVIVLPAWSNAIYSTNFNSCTKLQIIDMAGGNITGGNVFTGSSVFNTLILRRNTLCTLSAVNHFNNTPFASGKAGGTLYVPSALVASYQAANVWKTLLGYENNSILPIEGSIYETQYADGTPVTT